MPIVTLSGLYGGGARRLGPGVAQRLGADYVDRLILSTAARQVGATVEALHQREQRPPSRGERFMSMLQRVLERSAVTGAGGDPYFGPSAVALLTQEFEDLPQPTITKGHEVEDEKYIAGMREVIAELSKGGNVVMVGRGTSIILGENPAALRVGTVATWDDRVARVMDVDRLDKQAAEKTILARDRARAYYYKRYFEIDDPDDPVLYHMVINTSEMDIDYAIDLIVQASEALSEGRFARKAVASP